MSDFNVQITIRNARLLRLIREKFGTGSQLSRVSGVSKQLISGWLTMRLSPFLQSGELSEPAANMCAALGCYPEDIWPEHMKNFTMRRNSAEAEMSQAEVMAICESPERANIHRQLIARWAKCLNPREIEAIGIMQGGGTYEDAAKALKVTRERARQIELRGLRRLRQAALRDGIHNFQEAAQ